MALGGKSSGSSRGAEGPCVAEADRIGYPLTNRPLTLEDMVGLNRQ